MLSQETIQEAEAVLRHEWEQHIKGKGAHCRVCERWGKYNGIKLNKTMIKALTWLCAEYTRNGNKYVHLPTEAPRGVTRSYQLTSLKHWGLVSSLGVEVDENGELGKTRTTGLWRPTPQAYDFLNGQLSVPDHVFVYNNRRVGESDKHISVHECMEKQFDYGEAMARTFNGESYEFDND